MTKAILWEHEEEVYNIQQLFLEQQECVRKVTITQQMAGENKIELWNFLKVSAHQSRMTASLGLEDGLGVSASCGYTCYTQSLVCSGCLIEVWWLVLYGYELTGLWVTILGTLYIY
jgi:hypothetical protein